MMLSVLGALAASNQKVKKIFKGTATDVVYYSGGGVGSSPSVHLTDTYLLLEDSTSYKAATAITLDSFDLSRYSKVQVTFEEYTGASRFIDFRTYSTAPVIGSNLPAVVDEYETSIANESGVVEFDISSVSGIKYIGVRAKRTSGSGALSCKITDWRLVK